VVITDLGLGAAVRWLVVCAALNSDGGKCPDGDDRSADVADAVGH